MIRSMTGFGRGEAADLTRQVAAEIRSVNHRYSEISVRLPRRYLFAEDMVKKLVRNAIGRGNTEVYLTITSEAEEDAAVSVNIGAARQYFKGFRRLQSEFDVAGDITLELMASMPDVMKPNPGHVEEEPVARLIREATAAALEQFDQMRQLEGSGLAVDIAGRLRIIGRLLDVIEERAPQLSAQYAARLRERISELLGSGQEAPEERIALETAVLADKCNITEEIVRLRSHLRQFDQMIAGSHPSGPTGKKLDFLVQEMNREANTIGSKANDLKITDQMLEIKSEIEKIREQIQNIE